jgi:hypothetical protein
MKTIKWLLAGIIVGFIAVAFRDLERGEWLYPAIPRRSDSPGGEEPLLGYDGMDQETLLEWIPAANLDEGTLRAIMRYERANLDRGPILDALEEMIG